VKLLHVHFNVIKLSTLGQAVGQSRIKKVWKLVALPNPVLVNAEVTETQRHREKH